jgi:hypothetical protein
VASSQRSIEWAWWGMSRTPDCSTQGGGRYYHRYVAAYAPDAFPASFRLAVPATLRRSPKRNLSSRRD